MEFSASEKCDSKLHSGVSVKPTSVQHDVVDHIALVFGVVEAEGAAQIFGDVFRVTAVVTCLHMNGEAVPVTIQRQNKGGLSCQRHE